MLSVGGTEDHIHSLVRLGRSISQADWSKEIKQASSKWIKTTAPNLREFYWQSGYGAFSVDTIGVDGVRHYIETQEEHHRSKTFKEEYIELLITHMIKWDERYVWD